MAKKEVQAAFDALTAELERLYGAEHTHDFQDELDALETAIGSLPELAVPKPSVVQPPVAKPVMSPGT